MSTRLAAIGWLGIVLLAAAFLIGRAAEGMHFRTDLTALLPREAQDPSLAALSDAAVRQLSQRLILVVGDRDRDHARAAAQLQVAQPAVTRRIAALETDAAVARRSPVETTNVQLPSGDRLQIPTGAETLRLKSYLIMCRNSRSDYAEFADLVDCMDTPTAAVVLAGIDRYYGSRESERQWVATQLVRRLADPRPTDVDDDGDVDLVIVEDDGIGMSEEVCAHLFEQHRLEEPESITADGSIKRGCGLALFNVLQRIHFFTEKILVCA